MVGGSGTATAQRQPRPRLVLSLAEGTAVLRDLVAGPVQVSWRTLASDPVDLQHPPGPGSADADARPFGRPRTRETAERPAPVLAIDLDQQGNLTTRMGVTRDAEVVAVTAEVLTGEATAEEAAIAAPSVPGAFVLAGTHDLAQIDTQSVPDLVTALRDHLAAAAQVWDDVVIDIQPSLTGLTLAGLAAADVVVASVAIGTSPAHDSKIGLSKVAEITGNP